MGNIHRNIYHSNQSQDLLTPIEKFSYLKGQLQGLTADCIKGFSLVEIMKKRNVW